MDPETFSIERLIKTELPPLPVSVVRVTALLAVFDTSEQTIAEAISLDPILSSRILRLANSPIYALHGTVTNLASAVSTVGNTSIAEMLLISGISDSFGQKILNSPAGKKIWFHLIATAMAASEICRMSGLRGADEAFSCGLLHDIGKLIFLRADAPLYTSLLARAAEGGDISTLEIAEFGFDHAELGADAAVSWQLPGAVSHMIRFHHHPAKASAGVAMAHILNIADSLVNLKTADAPLDEFLRCEPISTFGLDADKFDTIWATVSERLGEVMATIG